MTHLGLLDGFDKEGNQRCASKKDIGSSDQIGTRLSAAAN
jgi:hypothetical protein